ncbi:MAG: hypothetical protein ACOX2F_00090 [bacterium]
MKVVFTLFFLALFPFSVFSQVWECETDSDCSTGMRCNDEVCIAPAANFSSYAAVSLKAGDNSPNSLGSKKIFVSHPAKNVVLGQLAIDANAGGEDGKLYLLRELSATIVSSNLNIKGENFKLVYDANGNGEFDSSEKIISTVETAEGSTIKFLIGQKTASYKMNVTEHFLIIGDFSFPEEMTLNSLWDFGIDIRPETGIKITNAGKADSVVVATVPEKISFPRFSFEPESGYFLFASGKYFPDAPSWKEMNKTHNIMHIRAKSLSGSNEIKSISIYLEGTVVSFGNGVKRISLYLDSNNDGKGDVLIEEKSNFETPAQSVLFRIPENTLALNEKEEKFLVVSAELSFYNSQTTRFYISNSGLVLDKKQEIAGVPVNTNQFKYSCDEADSGCVANPNNKEFDDDDSGCSILFIK